MYTSFIFQLIIYSKICGIINAMGKLKSTCIFFSVEISVGKHVLLIYRKTRYTARKTYCASMNYK